MMILVMLALAIITFCSTALILIGSDLNDNSLIMSGLVLTVICVVLWICIDSHLVESNKASSQINQSRRSIYVCSQMTGYR